MARTRTKTAKTKTKVKAKAKPRRGGNPLRPARTERRRLADILRPDQIKEQFIATAAAELAAIVEATATAANAIMDATETIEKVTGALSGEAARQLMQATSGIYEACGFQDITGQRVSKVVGAIGRIEERIDALIAALGGRRTPRVVTKKADARPSGGNAPRSVTDADLLNGPQLKSNAKTQEDIDAMFSGSGR